MSFKKLLGVITIVIGVMFTLMLTTSYAWYAFDEASTTFSAVTNNDDVVVSFQKGEYISTNIAVPISNREIDKYSDKNNFIIRVKDNSIDNEMLVTISLVEISIDKELQNNSFKIDLYHQNKNVASYSGDSIGLNGEVTMELGRVILDDSVDNNFELRLYILDDGTNQSLMMNKVFQARVQVNVVSRLKTTFTNYDNPDIYINGITIDGEDSNSLPVTGYYEMTSVCEKGSNLSWDALSKTITYNKGSYVNDSCSLTFISSNKYPLLNKMPVGSYVKYIGNNGCVGNSCNGENINYVNNNDMGYCSGYSDIGISKYTVSGYRIGYIKDDSAYLVSAGALECVSTSIKSNSMIEENFDGAYYYGSGYQFDDNTGLFYLTGVSDNTLLFKDSFLNVISDMPYTCKSASINEGCTTLYEIKEYKDNTIGKSYVYSGDYYNDMLINHINKLDSSAVKYCNKEYAFDGKCNSASVWAMDFNDFKNIVGNDISIGSCNGLSGNKNCGYNNDLIDNGGSYWLADFDSLIWNPVRRNVSNVDLDYSAGVRPVLKLKSSVKVIGGSGTYKDPYLIK